MAPRGLIDEVERAGLRGRGGAGFPTAAKLRAVAGASRSALGGARPIVVVNGAEGEPACAKDRTLLRSLPHLVIDGALLAATAVGAQEVLLGVCESSPSALDAVARALDERGARRGERVDGVHIQLRPVPNRYVAGHESALVNHLSGGPALPTFTPPRPFERGVRGRPTLVCNVETLAHLALIARHGSAWFRELGTPEQPGSALVTLAGSVAEPGVYEIEYGSPLTALLDAADGLTAQPRAVLLGGYSGTWIDGSHLREVALSDRHLSPFGASLGAGVVVVLSDRGLPRRRARSTHPLARLAERPPVRAVRVRPRRDRLRSSSSSRAAAPRIGRAGARSAPWLITALSRAVVAVSGTPSTGACTRSPGWSMAAAPARTPTASPASFRARSRCSRRSFPTTPTTAPAPPARCPRSCRGRVSPAQRLPSRHESSLAPSARQPDRLRGPRHVPRAAARAHLPG